MVGRNFFARTDSNQPLVVFNNYLHLVTKILRTSIFIVHTKKRFPTMLVIFSPITTQSQISSEKPVENTAGKGENAGYQHFLLFP